MKYTFRGRLAALSLLVLLSACAPGRSDPVSGGGGGARSMEEHFSNQVQPRLDFCRTCHIPGGIADVEDGKDFMLSSSKSEDLKNLRASWERLGKNNPTSRILLMASGQETPHTGGAPWPVGSDAYKAMEALLKCFESPTQCVLGEGGIVEELPLLGSKHAVHVWNSYCEAGQRAAAARPAHGDPARRQRGQGGVLQRLVAGLPREPAGGRATGQDLRRVPQAP